MSTLPNNLSFEQIVKRLKEAYNFKTDKQLADKLGFSKQGFSSWKKRKSIDWNRIIEKCSDISIDWLLLGEKKDDISEIKTLKSIKDILYENEKREDYSEPSMAILISQIRQLSIRDRRKLINIIAIGFDLEEYIDLNLIHE